MNPRPPVRVRVALAVTPRLLSDSLAALLSDAGLDVVTDPAPGEVLDVVVTTAGGTRVPADVVVELGNGDHGTAQATVRARDGNGPTLHLAGLPAIMEFLGGVSPRGQDRAGVDR